MYIMTKKHLENNIITKHILFLRYKVENVFHKKTEIQMKKNNDNDWNLINVIVIMYIFLNTVQDAKKKLFFKL